jgi:rubrerythrin
MSAYFSAGEILDVAMGIEQNGASFYQAMSQKTQDKDTRAIYDYLAGEEKKHFNTFKTMKNSVGDYTPPESYPGEYMEYLKSLIDNSVFTDEVRTKEIVARTTDEIEALDTGIQAEKDSILFYAEMQNLVPGSEHQIVYDIVNEERTHLRQLSELKEIVKKSRGL